MNEKFKKIAFLYFDKAVGKLYPLDSKKHEGWVGYTTNFCEKNDTFLFGVSPDEMGRKPLIVYYWGEPFDINGLSNLLDINKTDVMEYVKEYIQQFYDERIMVF